MSEEVLRKLPVGISDWRGIYTTDKFFVDKTQKLLELVTDKTKVFLSRPRRMGKSTLVSMLKDLFTNGDKNFKGTAIYGHWPQEERYPVITLDFMEIEGDERNNHPDDGDDIAKLHGLFASDFVHERGGGDAEQQEPDENHGRNEPCESLAQVEFLFRIGCQRAHDINKAHDEKAEQHGQDFG